MFKYVFCFLGITISLLASEKRINCAQFEKLIHEQKVTSCEISQLPNGVITEVSATCRLEGGLSNVAIVPPYANNLEQIVTGSNVDSVDIKVVGTFWDNMLTLLLPVILIGVPALILVILLVAVLFWFVLRQKT